MNFTLPISPDYVAHWGLWEAVREIYQNALDEQSLDPENEARIEHQFNDLRITTSKGHLTPETLVLGNTSKRDNPKQRGKFGEGYKLALLVLARLGFAVEVFTGAEVWTPKLEHSDAFNSTVLTIETNPFSPREGVEFVIYGISLEQWAEVLKNIRYVTSTNQILEAESQKGRIYVGGLYVTTVKGFHCGYDFVPGQVKLDRDRGMIDGFDLAYETSKLWEGQGSARSIQLINAGAPDVEYLESHIRRASPVVSHYSHSFYIAHGNNAIPVSSQDEIERASKAGMKWVLVSDKVKSILRLVHNWFIPTSKNPVEQLQEFRENYKWHMNAEMIQALDDIIRSMSPEEKPVEVQS